MRHPDRDRLRARVRCLAVAGCATLAANLAAPRDLAAQQANLGARPSPGAAALGAAHNRLTAAERAAGWRLLFDGTTLKGWRGLGRDTVPTAHWKVVDGAIQKVASGTVPHAPDGQPLAGGDLMTDAAYQDFEFAWEWKISPGGNSGVKYNVSEELSTTLEPRNAAKGFEYQVLDDDRHADGKLPSHRAGALYELVPPNAEKRLRPVGEWNRSRLVFRGTRGEHWLNGARVVEYELGSPQMRAALAASKYRVIPWFAERRRGHVVLQDHGDAAWFRDLKIRELGAGARTGARPGAHARAR